MNEEKIIRTIYNIWLNNESRHLKFGTLRAKANNELNGLSDGQLRELINNNLSTPEFYNLRASRDQISCSIADYKKLCKDQGRIDLTCGMPSDMAPIDKSELLEYLDNINTLPLKDGEYHVFGKQPINIVYRGCGQGGFSSILYPVQVGQDKFYLINKKPADEAQLDFSDLPLINLEQLKSLKEVAKWTWGGFGFYNESFENGKVMNKNLNEDYERFKTVQDWISWQYNYWGYTSASRIIKNASTTRVLGSNKLVIQDVADHFGISVEDLKKEIKKFFETIPTKQPHKNTKTRPLVRPYYYIYAIGPDGTALDEDAIDFFTTEKAARKFAEKYPYSCHIVFVPMPNSDEGPEYAEYIERMFPYEDYQIIDTFEKGTYLDGIDEALDNEIEFNAFKKKHPEMNKNFDNKKFGKYFDKDGKLIPELKDEYMSLKLFDESFEKKEQTKLTESAKTWTDVYKIFNTLIDIYFPDEDKIDKAVQDVYRPHRGEEIWDKAFEKWQADLDEEEAMAYVMDESLNEDLENVEVTDNTVVVPQPTGAAEEESKTLWDRFMEATKAPKDAPLFGAKKQPTPDDVKEPKAELKESLNEGLDGWDEEKVYEVINTCNEIYDLNYELENCVKGAYTGANTYSELADYIVNLGNRLAEDGENLKYVEEDPEDEEDIDESFKKKSSSNLTLDESLFNEGMKYILNVPSKYGDNLYQGCGGRSLVKKDSKAIDTFNSEEEAKAEIKTYKKSMQPKIKIETLDESLFEDKRLNEQVIKVTNIDWDTDGEDVDLPTEVDIPYYDLDLDGTEEDDYIIEDEISEYLSDVYGWLHNGFDYEVINESLKRNLKESSNDDVTIGIYGDEVDGFRSVDGLVDYFSKKGIKVSDVDGDFAYGWEMNLTGNPRQLFFAVVNTIPGYNSDSVQEFIDEYRIDESFKNKSRRNHKTINEAYIVSDFSSYEPWSGAVDTFNKIKDAGKLDDLEALIDETNPTGIYETELNDLLWFEADWVFQQLGMDTEEDIDESLKEAETQLYHTTYIIGSPDKADAVDEANLLEKEYAGSNIEFKPVKVDGSTWGVDFIGSFEDVLKVAKDFKPLGEFMEEPYTDYIKPVK